MYTYTRQINTPHTKDNASQCSWASGETHSETKLAYSWQSSSQASFSLFLLSYWERRYQNLAKVFRQEAGQLEMHLLHLVLDKKKIHTSTHITTTYFILNLLEPLTLIRCFSLSNARRRLLRFWPLTSFIFFCSRSSWRLRRSRCTLSSPFPEIHILQNDYDEKF